MAFDDGVPGKALVHGSTVTGSDGTQIGKVAAVGEGYFKVDAHHARDFWLPLDLVKNFDDEFTTLTVQEADLEAHKTFSAAGQLPEAELDGSVRSEEMINPIERRNADQAEYLIRPH